MWSLIRKDLGEFVSTIKDDAAVTIKSAMALGEGGGDEEYESSVRHGEENISCSTKTLSLPPAPFSDLRWRVQARRGYDTQRCFDVARAGCFSVQPHVCFYLLSARLSSLRLSVGALCTSPATLRRTSRDADFKTRGPTLIDQSWKRSELNYVGKETRVVQPPLLWPQASVEPDSVASLMRIQSPVPSTALGLRFRFTIPPAGLPLGALHEVSPESCLSSLTASCGILKGQPQPMRVSCYVQPVRGQRQRRRVQGAAAAAAASFGGAACLEGGYQDLHRGTTCLHLRGCGFLFSACISSVPGPSWLFQGASF